MLNVVLTIFCSTSIALIIKHNDSKSGNALLLLAGNYLVASLISFIFYISDETASASIESFVISAVLGVIFVFAFFSFTKAVNIAGAALATISSRLSVVVPVVLSILLFNEKPNVYHYAGFLLTLVTLYFFYFSLNNNGTKKLGFKDLFYLGAVLVGIGISDFGMKVFEQLRPSIEKPFFLFGIFGFAFIYSFGLHFYRKQSFDARTFFRGNLLGIPNMFSSFFLIAALTGLQAIVVYPVVNIGIITLTAVLAYFIWREKLNKQGIIALCTGVASIILLSWPA